MTSVPTRLNVPVPGAPVELFIHGEQDEFISKRIRQEGIWEPYETTLLLALLAPGDVFVDVGANIGYFSVLAGRIVQEQGAVYAFEPDSQNCELLRASAQHNKLEGVVNVVQAGLSDADGDGKLYLSENNYGDHQIYGSDDSRSSTAIKLLLGSAYLASRISQLDLLKIDTQGSEFQVMQGLRSFLAGLSRKPRMIIELTPYSLRQCGASGRQLIELLAGFGLPFWIIDHIEHRLVRSTEQDLALWCDNVDATPGDEGFMNILVGEVPESLLD